MIDRLAGRILTIESGHPVRVGLDGRSAAGKTTLADALASRLRERSGRTVIRAQLDYFMVMVADRNAYPYDSPESYYLDSWNYPAIRDQLLGPLGPGGDRRHRTALSTPDGRPVTGPPVEVAPDDAILVADGVFLQRPELAGGWDLTVYLRISLAESLRRGIARDAAWMGSAEEAERRYRSKYLPGEERYLAEVRPEERADVVIDSSDPARPRVVRGV
jgi:uridine kinase